MKPEDRKYYRQIAMASTLGFQVAFAIFIGLAIGVWLDSKAGTLPWLTLLFTVFGIVAGFLNYYRFAVKQQKDDEKDTKK